jgi:hypothetical protein
MLDIITYVEDSAALVAELKEKFPDLVDDDNNFLVTKTPTIRNAEGHSLALVRGDDQLVALGAQLEHLTLLGTYDEVFSNEDKLAIYNSVYDRTPKTFTDPETGEEYTVTPPEKFGVFCEVD